MRTLSPETQSAICGILPDHRVFLGEGLFETIRVLHGKPCFSHFHWARIKEAASQLAIPFTMSFEQWQETIINALNRATKDTNAIKIVLASGFGERGLSAKSQNASVHIYPFTYQKRTKSLHLGEAPWLRDSSNPIYRYKSINYLECILAKRQGDAQGFDDVLFLNQQRHVLESTIANVFLLTNSSLITPPLSEGILPGILRHCLIQLAQEHAIPCQEMPIPYELIFQADAVFLTNSLQGIQPVTQFNHKSLRTNAEFLKNLQKLIEEKTCADHA